MQKIKFTAEDIDFTSSNPEIESILFFNSEEERVISMQCTKADKGKNNYIERDDESFGTYNGVKEVILFSNKVHIKLNPEGKNKLQCDEITVDFEFTEKKIERLKKSLALIFGKSFTWAPAPQTKRKAKSAKKVKSKTNNDYSKIECLNLADKNLKVLPDYVAEMVSLNTLKLNNNPALDLEKACSVLSKLPLLKDLSITPSKFIPTNIGDLKNLEKLSITGLMGTSTVPKEIGKLNKMVSLYLSCVGELVLPHELDQLTHLERFDISATKWNLPTGFGNWEKLSQLSLTNCDIKEIPPSILKLKRLEKLYLNGTPELDLVSALHFISQIKSLTYLQLSNQQIPKEIGLCKQIKELRIFGAGNEKKPLMLPQTLWDLTQLEQLDLGGNYLPEIPEAIGNLTSLKTLSFYDCHLRAIPESIGNLKQLIVLNLSSNPELAKLPTFLENLKSLKIYTN